MATIVTRTGKGSALTFTEADDNFINLNNDGIANSTAITNLQNDKLDKTGGTVTGTLNVNGNLTLGSKFIGSSGNNSQSGTAVTLSGVSTEIVRLTSSSLVSIAGISGATSGQKLVLVNQTGVNVTILNDSVSAPAGEKIFTGNGSDVLLQQNASISFIYDNSSSRWQLIGGTGSGGGSSGINYIVNPDASTGTTGYTTYNDSAAAPVDGSGGTPAAGLWVRSTTTPLRGSGDFNLVKTGSTSYQGNGVAYDFTIDNADLARVLTVSFDYEVVSGTYATGDLTVYLIQDPTGTPVVIQPAGFQVVAATAGTKMTQIATFQTDSSQKNYRLCFHIATTSALDYTLALDNIVLGPTQKVYGAPVTDWKDYTPQITNGAGTIVAATLQGKYRQIGDSAQIAIEYGFGSGAGAASDFYLSIPFSIDTNKTLIQGLLGSGYYYSSATGFLNTDVRVASSSSVKFTKDALAAFIQGTDCSAAGASIVVIFSVPILGWSSNVEVSSSTDTRVVAARADRNGVNQTLAPNNSFVQVQINSIASTYAFDSHGAFNTSTYNYVAPLPGYYRVTGTVNVQGTNVLFTQYTTTIRVDGTDALQSSYTYPTAGTAFNLTVSGIIKLNAGQTVGLWFYGLANNSVNTLTLLGSASGTVFQIERLSGPSQIAASETVAFNAAGTAGDTITSGFNLIKFTTIEDNTHGAYNSSTGLFTAPIRGRYSASWMLTSDPVLLSTSQRFASILYKGTGGGSPSAYRNGQRSVGNGVSINWASAGSVQDILLNAGDTLSIYGVSDVTTTAATALQSCHFSVVRVGL